ncbi:hypothetical protein FDZ74_11400, partial [bacterium]
MKVRWRFLAAIALVLVLVGGSLLFPSLMLTVVVNPITRGLWLILNLFRAVDQKIYWGLLAIIVFGFGLLMVPRENEGPRRRLPGPAAKPRDAVAEWEQSMAAAGETPYQRDALQRRLNALKQTIGQLVEQDSTADLVLRTGRGQRTASILNRILPVR